MMQVEEKPDVTYSDIGGCKEQIEKLREVVETPLLSVGLLCHRFLLFSSNDYPYSPSVLSNLESILRKASSYTDLQAQERPCVHVLLPTEQMPHLFA
jgi:hypothetical protein